MLDEIALLNYFFIVSKFCFLGAAVKKLLFPCLLIILVSCKAKNGVSLIGLDESGKEVDVSVDRTVYQKALTDYVGQINLATVNALETTENPNWDFTKVDIGISATVSLNAGPIWKWSYSAGQRIIFTKN